MGGRFDSDENEQDDMEIGDRLDILDAAEPLFDLQREPWHTHQATGYAPDENDPLFMTRHVVHVFG